MFDMMPIAAVISKRYLCCSGGVSQWMTCLENIRNIPRPTYAKEMKFLEACLVADILHAQPNAAIERAFEPSSLGLSYMFNKKGLQSVLSALKLKTLIRTDDKGLISKEYPIGIVRNFNDDICFTVITSSDPHVSSCTTIELVYSQKHHALEQVYQFETDVDTMMVTCRRIMSRLGKSFEEKFIERSRYEHCNWCMDIPRSYFDLRARFYTHRDMDIWIRKYANEWAQADEIFLLNDNLHQSNPLNPSHEQRRIRRSAELFPSFYDLRFLEGGHPTKGGTFRVLINDDGDEQQQFMKTIYPNSHYLYDREPFSRYDSRHLDIDMTGSDELEQEERTGHTQRIRGFWQRLLCCFRNRFRRPR
uniref:protein-serine/threonine phosphatase n=1 Tax=Loa loa TaxID=7209 RepID=A0A1I7W0S2_LOALO